jgi:hypothetical protein
MGPLGEAEATRIRNSSRYGQNASNCPLTWTHFFAQPSSEPPENGREPLERKPILCQERAANAGSAANLWGAS